MITYLDGPKLLVNVFNLMIKYYFGDNLIFQGHSDELSAKFTDLTPNTAYVLHIYTRLGFRNIGEVKQEGKTGKKLKQRTAHVAES